MPDNLKFDLIVVGGGISGLSTVFHLLKYKFKGTIGLLEARSRLGGRIFTSKTKIEEEKIEMGANWIHGIINNPIYVILYDKKIIDSGIESNKSFYNIQAKTSNGKDVDTFWIHKVYKAYSNIIKGTSKFYNENKLEEIAAYHNSMGKYLNDEINKWIEKEVENEEDINIIRGLFDSLIKREICISGSNSMDDVTLQYFDQYKEFLGGNITVPCGYYSLIQILLDDIEEMNLDDKFNYFLESEIQKIEWCGLSQREHCENDSFIFKIKCSNGLVFECNHLVLTQPLGCLKKYAKTLFYPSLPDYKLQCIERMGFDIVDKIFLEYSSKRTILDVFTKDEIIIDEIMLIWDTGSNDIEVPDKLWYQKIYSIYRITDHCIQLWISGQEAKIMETLNEDQINDQLTEQFRKIFRNNNFPRADNVIVTKWGTDPFSLGSYSFIRTNSSPEDIEKLSKPIYLKPKDEKPIIVFGGEATHKEYFSTVHGAFLSGIDSAKNFV